ncbi:MAG: tRNA-dihydrouridine synthase family protein [Clostridia bacterium]|nr:tRNA-dihydrouridine synthase family protein [Clostridia bacterium]
MKYYLAPMEGLTDSVYRTLHHKYFGGVDRYYTPFFSPTEVHPLSARELRELAPQNNPVPVVPQLLCKNADDFLWMAGEIAALGYEEINLNLGCPSGTVTAKKKGAGMLADTDALDAFLDKVFAACPARISIKTRIGYQDTDEWPALLDIFGQYPVCELTVHPRTGKEMYRGMPHLDAYGYACQSTDIPLCYNGNVTTRADAAYIAQQFPSTQAIMIGRGLMANPALLSDKKVSRTLIRDFHEELMARYRVVLGSEQATVGRMKEIWLQMQGVFESDKKYVKRLQQSKTEAELCGAVMAMICELPLKVSSEFDKRSCNLPEDMIK